MDKKYIVFDEEGSLCENEFLVLRKGDVVSTMTIRSYIQNILHILDWNINPETGEKLSAGQRLNLRLSADRATDLFEEWLSSSNTITE